MKVVSSNSGNTTGSCSCKVANTHTYCVDNNYKEPLIDLETIAKSNKNLDQIQNQENKNITEKLDSDNINEKNKKQEYRSENNSKKEDQENKKHKYVRKLKTVKMLHQRKNRKLYIF